LATSETANGNNPDQTTHYQSSHPIYSIAGEDIAEHSSILNAGNQVITSQLSSQKSCESNQHTQLLIKARRRNSKSKQRKKIQSMRQSRKDPIPGMSHLELTRKKRRP
jgi:hypothetical protein